MGQTYAQLTPLSILNGFRSAPFKTRMFLFLRWILTPYSQMIQYLPSHGKILDLGCGHGLFAISAASQRPSCEVVALDHDAKRVRMAAQAASGLPNLRIVHADLMGSSKLASEMGPWAALCVIDTLHYLSASEQVELIRRAFSQLQKDGIFLMREVDLKPGLRSSWNKVYERIATAFGWTKSVSSSCFFRSSEEWRGILQEVGFSVSSTPCSSILFSDILFVARRP